MSLEEGLEEGLEVGQRTTKQIGGGTKIMELSLAGKTALVCGASQGIGAAAARELASLGCRVVVLARTEAKLRSLVDSLEGTGPHAYCACDINAHADISSWLTTWVNQNGPIHIVVNNTGGPKAGPLLESADEEFARALNAHVLSAQLLAKLLVPGMQKSRYGRIINVISTSAKVPIPNLGVSNTIRAAMAHWAKSLSLELGPLGVTVNNVLPGYTETERLESLISQTASRSHLSGEAVRTQWRATIPLGRFAQPAEVAAAIAFLASPAAAYISGINLPVDGGRTGCL